MRPEKPIPKTAYRDSASGRQAGSSALVSKQAVRQKRQNTRALLAVVLAGLVVVTLALAILLMGRTEEPSGMPAAIEAQPPPAQSEVAGGDELPEDTFAEEAPVLEVPPPVTLEEPAGGWPEIEFTEEEKTALDAMLAEWAEAEALGLSAGEEETPENGQASTAQEADPLRGHHVAVYFKDLDSGAEYIYNGDEKFDVASLSKAPYAMYLYHLIENGQASLEETFLIDAASIEGSEENTGRIKEATDLPREYTLEELIFYLLRYSDTVAQRVLLARYPAADYAAWAAELGLHYPEDVRGVTSGMITARDAGVYLEAMKGYMDSGEYGAQLQEHLMNTGNPMIRSAYPVARKYGWDVYAYHDMAVVYAPHPYIIAILTDKSGGQWEDLNRFSTIPQAFEQVMGRHWATEELGPDTKMGVA